jgi:hypothetical protein
MQGHVRFVPIADIVTRSAQCSYVMSLGRRSKPTASSASSKRRKFSAVGLVVRRRRNFSLPIATYLHSQRLRVHRGSGKRGTVSSGYSLPNCPTTASHGLGPGRMRTPRNKPSLCAFRNARSERAICDGLLCIGRFSRSTGIQLPPRSALKLKFRIIVRPNARRPVLQRLIRRKR